MAYTPHIIYYSRHPREIAMLLWLCRWFSFPPQNPVQIVESQHTNNVAVELYLPHLLCTKHTHTHKRDGIRASTTFFVKFMKYTHDTTCIHIKTRLATKRRRSVGWCYILKPPQKKINFSCSKNKWAFLHISFVTDALDPFPYLNLFLPVLYFYSTVRLFSCGMHMRFSRVGPLVEKASFNT